MLADSDSSAIASVAMSGNLPLRRSCRGLLVDGEQILLAQHSIGDGRTVWVGPGGGVEDDESLVQTLARELHEETGLVLTGAYPPRLVWIQTAEFREMKRTGLCRRRQLLLFGARRYFRAGQRARDECSRPS